jgi:hypothetical protein
VDEPVENSIGDGRVGDDVVPVVDRQLAGDDGAATAVAVVDDLEDIAAFARTSWSPGPNHRQ